MGVAQRLKYLSELERRFDLARHPEHGRPRPELGAGLRSQRQGRHVILYRQRTAGVLVLRVLHDRMDPGRHLTEEAE